VAGATSLSLPTTLAELGGGRDTLTHWRRQADLVARTAQRHPELATVRRPVLSHEGPGGIVYADTPPQKPAP
jgi:hypothetical protein